MREHSWKLAGNHIQTGWEEEFCICAYKMLYYTMYHILSGRVDTVGKQQGCCLLSNNEKGNKEVSKCLFRILCGINLVINPVMSIQWGHVSINNFLTNDGQNKTSVLTISPYFCAVSLCLLHLNFSLDVFPPNLVSTSLGSFL